MFFVLAKEYCRTLFAYEGTNEDELTFKEGEIIQLISKVRYVSGFSVNNLTYS